MEISLNKSYYVFSIILVLVIFTCSEDEVYAQHTKPEAPPLGTSISITEGGVIVATSHDPAYDPLPEGYVYKPEPVLVSVTTVDDQGEKVIEIHKYWIMKRHEKWSIGGNLKDYGSYLYGLVATLAILFKNIGSLTGFIRRVVGSSNA